MLFYFNINVCRDLPYVIYQKQYVTVKLKLCKSETCTGNEHEDSDVMYKNRFQIRKVSE